MIREKKFERRGGYEVKTSRKRYATPMNPNVEIRHRILEVDVIGERPVYFANLNKFALEKAQKAFNELAQFLGLESKQELTNNKVTLAYF